MQQPEETYVDPFEDDGDVWGDDAPACDLSNPEICESCT